MSISYRSLDSPPQGGLSFLPALLPRPAPNAVMREPHTALQALPFEHVSDIRINLPGAVLMHRLVDLFLATGALDWLVNICPHQTSTVSGSEPSFPDCSHKCLLCVYRDRTDRLHGEARPKRRRRAKRRKANQTAVGRPNTARPGIIVPQGVHPAEGKFLPKGIKVPQGSYLSSCRVLHMCPFLLNVTPRFDAG